jgi:methionyl-tRNA synthetase
MTDKPHYITTAISYPNGKPHIGHAYEAIATDAIARFHRLAGREVRFLTGTDEHGLKMVQTARDAGLTPKQMADQNTQSFKDMCACFDISHDRFIRTTDSDHHATVTELWRRMSSNGDIYLGRYEGWYSIRDEAYYADDEVTTGEDGVKLSPQGTPVEWTVEESYFFRLSAYKDRLIDHIQNNDFIQPPHRKNEILSFLSGELRDLSISRSSFDWGVPVPDCSDLGVEHVPGHVMYVWVDALTNYLTGIRDGSFEARAARWAASDITHIIGKDIVRFHTVYWPAFLMSANIPLPGRVFGHGFLLNRGEKMSKSLGNVVDPMDLADRFGVDAVRWYMLRKVSFGEDGGYSAEDIVQTYNADLANSFGNLVQRVFSFIAKNCEGRVPVRGEVAAEDRAALASIFSFEPQPQPDVSSGDWLAAVYRANQYVDSAAPWALRKTDPVRMETVLAVLLDMIRALAIGCQSFIPASANKVLAMFSKDAFHPNHLVIPANAGIQRSGQAITIETGASLDPGVRRDDEFNVMFDAINESDWYARWAASRFVIQPPTPIFPRLEMPIDV